MQFVCDHRNMLSRFLFPTPTPSYTVDSFPTELLWVPKRLEMRENCPSESCVPCLFLRCPSARFLFIFFHSNAEDIGRCYAFASLLRDQFQVHVFVVEYPGYGICPGVTSPGTICENAHAAMTFVTKVLQWPLDGIKIVGRSIGTGPAMFLASKFLVSGVILVTPFLSIKDVFKDKIGGLADLIEDCFVNKDLMPRIRSPVLIIHGKRDRLIPTNHGEKLYELCRTRKLLVCPTEMEHNTNLFSNLSFFVLPMLHFFSLPDYAFEEIKVPKWAYNKRLSPFYEKPRIQLQSDQKPTAVGGRPPEVPRGDMIKESPRLSTAEESITDIRYEGFIHMAKGDREPPFDNEQFAVEIAPTTRHTIASVTRNKNFQRK